MSYRGLQDIVTALPGKRVLVIGDVMLDEYIWGEVRRISPEAPVPVVEARRRTYIPGGAANTAANVVSLSGQAMLGGVVGRDHQASRLSEALQVGGIESLGLIVDEDRPTTTKTRIVAHSQQVVRVDSEACTPLAAELEDTLLQWAERCIGRADACILSDYNKGIISARLATDVIRLARQAGRPVVVDPKGTNYSKYRGATVVTPNIYEAQRAIDSEVDDEQGISGVGQRLLDILGGAALLITRGAQGMSLFTKGAPPLHIPANARNVYDVTGAGDTVVSMLALALAADASLEQAVDLANHAAGIVVGKFGTATVSLTELSEHLAKAHL
jgi:D-beta-D-heptose 7-phosphate kinase/D-beta-D-heptose 1-phosphate adenosyltransferase